MSVPSPGYVGITLPAALFVTDERQFTGSALQRTWTIDASAAAWLLGALLVAVLAGAPWRALAATTLAGMLAMAVGAWRHVWTLVVAGAVAIARAWMRGLFHT